MTFQLSKNGIGHGGLVFFNQTLVPTQLVEGRFSGVTILIVKRYIFKIVAHTLGAGRGEVVDNVSATEAVDATDDIDQKRFSDAVVTIYQPLFILLHRERERASEADGSYWTGLFKAEQWG